jgi:hypothetical protein
MKNKKVKSLIINEETWFSLMTHKMKNGFKNVDSLIKSFLKKEENRNEVNKENGKNKSK